MKNIIIVDMQKGFINKNNEFLIEKINLYLKNNKFTNIFYTKLFDNNIKPIFLKDLCASSSSDVEMKQKSLDIISRSFGKDCIK